MSAVVYELAEGFYEHWQVIGKTLNEALDGVKELGDSLEEDGYIEEVVFSWFPEDGGSWIASVRTCGGVVN